MPAAKSYHHKDLRSVLLKAAAQIIAKQGLPGLTLRGLSRRVGVSHTAPYRHFADKTDLLCALAEEGFKRLTGRYKKINQDRSIDSLQRLQAIGLAYIEFAITNPNLFKLMLGREIPPSHLTPGLREAAGETYGQFRAAVRAVGQEHRLGIADLSLANISWAMVQGLATLIIDRQVLVIGQDGAQPALLAKPTQKADQAVSRYLRFAQRTMADFWAMLGLPPAG